MKTLARIVGGLMVADGTMLLARPHDYLRFWNSRHLPDWIRVQVEPFLKLPDASLRWLGADEVVVGGLLLGLAERG